MYLEDPKNRYVEPGLRPLNEVQIVLYRAADLLRHRGWCQVSFFAPGGEYCMVGAIIDAGQANDNLVTPAHRVILKHGYGMSWNDDDGRTAAEVISALEAVASSYQASEGRGSNHV